MKVMKRALQNGLFFQYKVQQLHNDAMMFHKIK